MHGKTTTAKAAVKLKVTRRRVLALIKQGKIKAEKISDTPTSAWLIDNDALDDYCKLKFG